METRRACDSHQYHNVISLLQHFCSHIFPNVNVATKLHPALRKHIGEGVYDILHFWMIWCNPKPNQSKWDWKAFIDVYLDFLQAL